MGFISFRTYLLGAVIVGGVVLLMGIGFGEDIVSWAARQERNARVADLRAVGTLVMGPIEFWFDPDRLPFGAIVAGIFWPLVIFWPLMVLIHFIAIEGLGAFNESELAIILPWFWL